MAFGVLFRSTAKTLHFDYGLTCTRSMFSATVLKFIQAQI